MGRLKQWCADINRVQSDVKYDFAFVDEEGFGKYQLKSFKALTDGFNGVQTGNMTRRFTGRRSRSVPLPPVRWCKGAKQEAILLPTVEQTRVRLSKNTKAKKKSFQQAMGRMRPLWDKYWVFYSESFSNFGTVGAIAPSSALLARAIVHPLQDRPEHPISVLEVGPGTGAFTARILKCLGAGDTLDIYELNPRFHRYLTRFLQRQDLQDRGVLCRLHHADIRGMKQPKQYDFIISGLPFNSFDAQTVDEILEILMSHLTATGVFAYFEYSLTHRFRGRFLKPPARDRLREVGATVRNFIRKHQFRSRQVWWNLPPAKARYCRKRL